MFLHPSLNSKNPNLKSDKGDGCGIVRAEGTFKTDKGGGLEGRVGGGNMAAAAVVVGGANFGVVINDAIVAKRNFLGLAQMQRHEVCCHLT